VGGGERRPRERGINLNLELTSSEYNNRENAEENSNEAVCGGDIERTVVEFGVRKEFFDNRTEREWLSTEEAAYFLSISPNALRIMVHRDQIQAFKIGRRLRFRVQDCRRLFQRKGE
jgi:excisionase family DNA binding protein